MSNQLKWELDWIDAHPDYYWDLPDREAVKERIALRYLLNWFTKAVRS